MNKRFFFLYEVDRHGFICGNHHQEFLRFWEFYNPREFDRMIFEGNAPIEMVSSSVVEGIQISQYDIDNPVAFWGQHFVGGTIDTFTKIAANIPKVRAELELGRSLPSLLEDKKLGKCASMYFDPVNMVQVIKHDGFYEFQSDGRHRILAARELGFDVPVIVIGTCHHK